MVSKRPNDNTVVLNKHGWCYCLLCRCMLFNCPFQFTCFLLTNSENLLNNEINSHNAQHLQAKKHNEEAKYDDDVTNYV